MELLQLEYFKVIAQYQNITQAAEHLHVSQSSLSNMLSRIENELGVKLFNRQGRTIILNEYGQLLQRRGSNILNELQELYRDVAELKIQKDSQLSVNCTHARLLAHYVVPFIHQSPNINVQTRITHIQGIERALSANMIDFGIVINKLDEHLFHHQAISKDQFVFCVPHTHHLAHLDSVYFADIADESFIALPPDKNDSRFIDYLNSQANTQAKIIFEGDMEIIHHIFHQLNGGIISLESICPKTNSDYTMIKLKDEFSKIDISLCWPKSKTLSPAANAFLTFLTNDYQPIQLPLNASYATP